MVSRFTVQMKRWRWCPKIAERLAHSFVDVLAELHALDPDDIGLGNLGKTDSYIGRQLKTWYRSWTSSVEDADFDDERAHELQRYFLGNLPAQGEVRVVHGDYYLHNCLIGPDCSVAAVVDWEISTLGDPLADLAYALNNFPDPSDEIPVAPETATAVPGFPTRTELVQRYAQKTGRDLSNVGYYFAFNRWKTACISHGVYARYMAGKKSSDDIDLALMRSRLDISLTRAEHAVDRIRSR